MADRKLQPHDRVKWLSKYKDIWFHGHVRRVMGDRTLVEHGLNGEARVIVISTHRLFHVIR